ncbi:MAG: T9SS type A sorting domain-containing protein [Saprospiraceae bacterium]
MKNILNQINFRNFRFSLIALQLLFSSIILAQATLCETLSEITISSTTIDLSTTTGVVPNWPVSTNPNYKRAYQRLVLVSNVVTVSSNIVIFEDCDIRMAENAGFIVPSGKNLVFKNCRIAAYECDKLWDKVDVQGGTLSMLNNTIEDAKIVIFSAVGGSRITSKDNVLNRNYLGMYLTTTLGQKAFVCDIGYNTYKQSGDEINAYPNQPNAKIAGVILNNINGISISGDFENLNNGVKMSNSVADISGSTFRDIQTQGQIRYHLSDFEALPFTDGIGIFVGNSNCRVTNSTFDNCMFSGIAANSSTINCKSSIFENVNEFGVLAVNLRGAKRCVVNDNTFNRENMEEMDAFVFLRTFVAGEGDEISQNTFNYGDNCSTKLVFSTDCIYVNGNSVSSCKIMDNSFTGTFPTYSTTKKPGCSAIDMVSCFNGEISGNTIEVASSNSTSTGILLGVRANNCNVKNNTVSSNINYGLFVEDAQYSNLCSNILDNPATGLYMHRDCLGSILYHNEFSNNSSNAMLFDGNGIGIKPQKHHGNRFKTSQESVFYGGLDYQNAIFLVNNQANTNCYDSEYMPSNVSPSNWFQSQQGCTTSCTINSSADDSDNEISVLDVDIISNNLSQYEYTDAQVWSANYNLLKRLTLKPELITNTDIASYFTATTSSNIGKCLAIENKIQMALYDQSYMDDVNDLTENQNNLLETVYLKLQDCIAFPDSVELDSLYGLAVDDFITAQEALDQFVLDYTNARNLLFAEALDLNAEIETQSTIGENLVAINALRIKYYMENELDENEWDEVKQIADICYEVGGLPTSLAIALLSRRLELTEDPCSNNEERIVSPQKHISNAVFYPNPATNELNINYKFNSESNGKIEVKVYDLTGRLVMSKKLNLNDFRNIDISGLLVGFYHIHLYEDKCLVKTDKFVKSN